MLEEYILLEIDRIVKEAGQIILSAHLDNSKIHQKTGPANFVTDYDVRIQKKLIEELSALLPDATYFGEEDTEENKHSIGSGYTFFIDPIDGTTNFMFDYQNSCVSVGLADHGVMIAGWVYLPYTDRIYRAVKDQGAFLNGNRLMIDNSDVSEGIVAFGCARYNDGDADLLFDIVKELFHRSLSIRDGGSAAIDLCRIASQSNVGYIELLLQPYDYAAASVIITEAGGVISQVDGQQITLDRPCSIVAGTPKSVEEIRKIYNILKGV